MSYLKRGLTATLLLLALIAAGCASSTSSTATVDAEDATEAETAVEETVDEEPAEEEAAEEEPVAEEPVELETQTIPDLGTSLEIDFPIATDTFTGLGAGVFGRAGETTPVDSGLVFMRPTGFVSEELRGNEFLLPLLSETFETWLTHPEISVISQSETMVSGFDATVTDLTVERSDEILQDCGPPPQDQCINFASTPDAGPFGLTVVRTGQTARIWNVDQGGELPLLIIAFANEGDDDWLSIVDEAMETIVLGDPQPAPESRIQAVDAGQNTFGALGGMTIDLPVESLAFEGTQCVLFQFPQNVFEAGVLVGRIDQDWEGAPIDTVDDYMALSQGAVTFTETGESIELFGTTLTHFDMELTGENPSGESCAAIGGDLESDISASFAGKGGSYLADAEDGGFYIVSWATINDDEAERYEGIFDEMVATIEVAGG